MRRPTIKPYSAVVSSIEPRTEDRRPCPKVGDVDRHAGYDETS